MCKTNIIVKKTLESPKKCIYNLQTAWSTFTPIFAHIIHIPTGIKL